MKKVLAIVAIAAFAACNNAPSESAAVDSVKYKDSVAKANAPVKVDSPAVKKDSPVVKVDSPAVKKM